MYESMTDAFLVLVDQHKFKFKFKKEHCGIAGTSVPLKILAWFFQLYLCRDWKNCKNCFNVKVLEFSSYLLKAIDIHGSLDIYRVNFSASRARDKDEMQQWVGDLRYVHYLNPQLAIMAVPAGTDLSGKRDGTKTRRIMTLSGDNNELESLVHNLVAEKILAKVRNKTTNPHMNLFDEAHKKEVIQNATDLSDVAIKRLRKNIDDLDEVYDRAVHTLCRERDITEDQVRADYRDENFKPEPKSNGSSGTSSFRYDHYEDDDFVKTHSGDQLPKKEAIERLAKERGIVIDASEYEPFVFLMDIIFHEGQDQIVKEIQESVIRETSGPEHIVFTIEGMRRLAKVRNKMYIEALREHGLEVFDTSIRELLTTVAELRQNNDRCGVKHYVNGEIFHGDPEYQPPSYQLIEEMEPEPIEDVFVNELPTSDPILDDIDMDDLADELKDKLCLHATNAEANEIIKLCSTYEIFNRPDGSAIVMAWLEDDRLYKLFRNRLEPATDDDILTIAQCWRNGDYSGDMVHPHCLHQIKLAQENRIIAERKRKEEELERRRAEVKDKYSAIVPIDWDANSDPIYMSPDEAAEAISKGLYYHRCDREFIELFTSKVPASEYLINKQTGTIHASRNARNHCPELDRVYSVGIAKHDLREWEVKILDLPRALASGDYHGNWLRVKQEVEMVQ